MPEDTGAPQGALHPKMFLPAMPAGSSLFSCWEWHCRDVLSWGDTELCSWPDPSAVFPTSAYRVQSAGNPAVASSRSHPLQQVPRAAGGARQWGRTGQVTQLLSPRATQVSPVGTARMLLQSSETRETNVSSAGSGGGGVEVVVPSPL